MSEEKTSALAKAIAAASTPIHKIEVKPGLVVTVKEPIGEVFLKGIRLCGDDANLIGLCQAMLCVVKVNDELVVPPQNYEQILELSNKLTFKGVAKLTNWFNELLSKDSMTPTEVGNA